MKQVQTHYFTSKITKINFLMDRKNWITFIHGSQSVLTSVLKRDEFSIPIPTRVGISGSRFRTLVLTVGFLSFIQKLAATETTNQFDQISVSFLLRDDVLKRWFFHKKCNPCYKSFCQCLSFKRTSELLRLHFKR